MKKLSVLFLVIVFFTFGCQTNSDDKASSLTKVSLRQEFIPYSGFAGEVYASYVTDSINNLELTVEISSDDIDPVKMILNGTDDFGVVGADRLVIDNIKGADLVVIGVANYKTPVVFISNESEINEPKDFENDTIGVMSGTHVEYVYRAMLNAANVNTEKIYEVEAPFDMATYLAEGYDVHPIFSYVESTYLDNDGVKYTVVNPEDYGVSYIGTVYFTTRKMVQEKPQIVQAFINSIADGWKATLSNPTESINYLVQYDKNLNKEIELKSLKRGLDYFRGEEGKILYASMNSWNNTVNHLKKIDYKTLGLSKPIPDNFDISDFIDYSFLEKYNQGK